LSQILKKYCLSGFLFKFYQIEGAILLSGLMGMLIAVLTEENPTDALVMGKKLKAVAINPWWKTLTKDWRSLRRSSTA
jgi:hypothetical protein